MNRLRQLLGFAPVHDKFRDAEVIRGACAMEEAYSGIAVVGGPGSGKTTSVGAEAAMSVLRLGCGGIVMCAKIDEADRWKRYAEVTGRSNDIAEFTPGGGEACDILNAELNAKGGSPESAAQFVDVAAELSGRKSGFGGDERYWTEMLGKGNRRAITGCWKARGKCSLVDLYMMYASAPTCLEQVADPAWRARSFCWEVLAEGMQKCPDDYDFALAMTFWLQEWPGLGDKTRSICLSVATNLLDKFMSGPMMKMVADGRTTHGPDSTLNGKVLLINMPVLRYQEQGIFFAGMMKMGVQRAALRRDVREKPRPVFVFADEAQFFMLPSQDMMVSTVARQSRLIQFHMFQNLPMLYAALGGGDKARNEVDGWLSCHGTKIALSNSCVATGNYFSQLFGSSWQDVWSGGTGGGGQYSFTDDLFGRRQQGGPSMNWTPHWRPDVPVEEFTRLRRGGPPGYTAEGFCFQGGRLYENGRPWKLMEFRQHF